MYLQCYTNALRELEKKYNKYTGEEIKLTPHILTYLLYKHGEHGNTTKRISTLWGIKISQWHLDIMHMEVFKQYKQKYNDYS